MVLESDDMPRLKNRRHERFCQCYVSDGRFNGAAAARAVGVSRDSAHVQASKWLSNANILGRVDELTQDILSDVLMTKEELIAELNKLAKFNPKDLYDDDGRLIPVHELNPDVAASVQEIETVDGVPVKVKGGKDKSKAIETGLKYYNAFEDHQKSGAGEIHVHLDSKDQDA